MPALTWSTNAVEPGGQPCPLPKKPGLLRVLSGNWLVAGERVAWVCALLFVVGMLMTTKKVQFLTAVLSVGFTMLAIGHLFRWWVETFKSRTWCNEKPGSTVTTGTNGRGGTECVPPTQLPYSISMYRSLETNACLQGLARKYAVYGSAGALEKLCILMEFSQSGAWSALILSTALLLLTGTFVGFYLKCFEALRIFL